MRCIATTVATVQYGTSIKDYVGQIVVAGYKYGRICDFAGEGRIYMPDEVRSAYRNIIYLLSVQIYLIFCVS